MGVVGYALGRDRGVVGYALGRDRGVVGYHLGREKSQKMVKKGFWLQYSGREENKIKN